MWNPFDPRPEQPEPARYDPLAGKPWRPSQPPNPPPPATPAHELDTERARKNLTNPKAAHETAGVLRMHRAGWVSWQICQVLKISAMQLRHMLQLAIDDEQTAHLKGLEIWDTKLPKGMK